MAENDPLRAYVERLMRLSETQGRAPDAETLAAVAAELGLDEASVARAAEEHGQRGRHFAEHGLLDDAVREWTEAAVLRPGDADTAMALAKAHAARWRRDGRVADRAAAERQARRCLALRPDYAEAYTLLRDLKPRRVSPARLALGGVAAVAVGLGAAVLGSGGGSPAGEATLPEATAAASATGAAAAASGAVDPAFQKAAPRQVELPVEASLPAGLRWTPHAATLKNYAERSFLTVQGLLRNETGRLVREVPLEIEVVDARGQVVERVSMKRPGRLDPALRPGDTAHFHRTLSTDARAAAVRLRGGAPTAEAPPAAWPESRPLELGWVVVRPADLGPEALVLRERESRSTDNTLGGGYFHSPVFEVAYGGPRPVDKLRLQIRRFDAAGNAVSTDLVTVAGGALGMPLLPGETRVVRGTGSVPAPVTRYEVAVAEFGGSN